MVTVKIHPGPCGFEALVEARAVDRYEVRMSVTSDCPAVMNLGRKLETLTLTDIVGKKGFGRVRPFIEAAGTLFHATCPALAGFLKAAEVEMGLAVPRDVTIEFITGDDE